MLERTARVSAVLVATLTLAVAGAASADLRPTVLARLSYGPGDRALAPWNPETDPGEGVPTAWAVDGAGRIHVLVPHERTVLVLGPNGAPERKVRLLRKDGRPLPANAFLCDLAFAPDGGWLVLDEAGGRLLRFGPEGRLRASAGALTQPTRLEVAHDGEVLVRDAAENAVVRFTPDLARRTLLRDRLLAPLKSPTGLFARVHVARQRLGHVWLLDPSRPTLRTHVALAPSEPGALFYELAPVAFDAAGRLVLVGTEKGARGYTSQVWRVSTSGRVERLAELEACLEPISRVPRWYRLLDDGRLLGFRTEEDAWLLVAFALPVDPTPAALAPGPGAH